MQKTLVRFIAIALMLSPLSAEDVQLKDGSKVSGKLIGVNGDNFQIKTAYGEISVPRSEIITISFPDNAPKTSDADGKILPPIDEELKGVAYTNRTADFQITVPSGWKIAPELRKSKDIAAALESDDETLFFMATPEKFSGTLATYKTLAESQFKSNFSDYEKSAEVEQKIDGRTGIRMIFRGKSNVNHADIKFLVYIVPYEGRMVRLSFFTLEPLFTDGVPIFEKIAASYHSGTKLN